MVSTDFIFSWVMSSTSLQSVLIILVESALLYTYVAGNTYSTPLNAEHTIFLQYNCHSYFDRIHHQTKLAVHHNRHGNSLVSSSSLISKLTLDIQSKISPIIGISYTLIVVRVQKQNENGTNSRGPISSRSRTNGGLPRRPNAPQDIALHAISVNVTQEVDRDYEADGASSKEDTLDRKVSRLA
jgi:hypothetical protein